MAFYADDAVVKNHPLDDDFVATGIDEIRALEEKVPAVQGSGDGVEFFDIVVSGSTVTFSYRFSWDRTRSGGAVMSAGCAGDTANTATIEDGKITLYNWNFGSTPSVCP